MSQILLIIQLFFYVFMHLLYYKIVVKHIIFQLFIYILYTLYIIKLIS